MGLFGGKKKEDDKIFAIGDVHGCSEELARLLAKIPFDENSTIIFVGDLIDRGPDSKGVLDLVLALREKTRVVGLMGNHEHMLLSFIDDPESEIGGMFIYNGGSSTLASYGADDGTYTIPAEHMDFYRELKLSHETDEYYFVHAGVPDCDLNEIDGEKDVLTLLWIREKFLKSSRKWGKKIIHGHTPVVQVENKPNRINIDTGCVFNGKLTAVGLPSETFYEVPKSQDTEHVYLRDKDSQRKAIRFKGSIPVQLEFDGQMKDFLTINFSEFGLYIKDPGENAKPIFKGGDAVKGLIGSGQAGMVEFTGKLVRVDENRDGVFYAIQLDNPALAKF